MGIMIGVENIAIASLLHDIGKIRWRVLRERKNHQDLGADWLEKKGLGGIISGAARSHHGRRFSDIKISNYLLVVYEADNLSAGERRIKDLTVEEGEEEGEFEPGLPLLSIFSRISLHSSDSDVVKPSLLNPASLESTKIFPKTSPKLVSFDEIRDYATSSEGYEELWNNFENDFDTINKSGSISVDTLLFLLQKYTSSIPSHTFATLDKETRNINWKYYPDISLFDHVKSTATIASALYRYLQETVGERFEREQLIDEIITEKAREEKRYLLVGGDLTGIQDFIYTLATGGALRTLRGRSFYVELLCHHIANEIIKNLGLTRTNIVFVGGGGCYILTHNTENARRKISEIENKINSYLFDNFGGRIYFGLSFIELSGFEIAGVSTETAQMGFGELWKELKEKMDLEKTKKWKNNLNQIFQIKEPKKERCNICREEIDELIEIDIEKDVYGCGDCNSFYNLGKKLAGEKFRFVLQNPSSDVKGFDIFGSNYILSDAPQEAELVFVLNSLNPKDYISNNAVFLPYGRYGMIGEFQELAKLSMGIERIGALRMDVDNLGQIFSRGLNRIREGEKISYQSFSRVASLSRELDLFFKFHLGQILECKSIEGFESFRLFENMESRHAVIIYSGGDDLFIAGAWSDIIETAFDIHRSFNLYTGENPNLDISGGATAFDTKYPLYKMAEEVGELEEKAKMNKRDNDDGDEKKSLSLFNSNLVFKWNEAEQICLKVIRLLIKLCEYESRKVRFKLPRGFIYDVLSVYNKLDEIGAFWHPKLFYITTRVGEKLRDLDKEAWSELRNVIMKLEINKPITAGFIWLDLLLRGGKEE